MCFFQLYSCIYHYLDIQTKCSIAFQKLTQLGVYNLFCTGVLVRETFWQFNPPIHPTNAELMLKVGLSPIVTIFDMAWPGTQTLDLLAFGQTLYLQATQLMSTFSYNFVALLWVVQQLKKHHSSFYTVKCAGRDAVIQADTRVPPIRMLKTECLDKIQPDTLDYKQKPSRFSIT